ncbi:ABC transporter substrate-binding protein [Marinobacter sp. SS21]|uniref:ABC transporter substrate-binding protein n=1 Tax=Marinobacter sp. SS21 TaxID=2979460 RepID=UPI00232EDB9F|nr:ABC transporter substrate-binding protein [Marinobacter sp. SS21]MDC0663173.1 ABC transporter substrate-binding protein [Marinobacter sp. SS21]
MYTIDRLVHCSPCRSPCWRVLAALALWLGSLGLLAPVATKADPLPTLSLSVLQFGTAHWELDHLQRRRLDASHGFDLDLRLVANLPASRLALSSGTVDGAVADLLWVQSRFEAGTRYVYLPFSSHIGDVVVPADSAITTLADLAGKRIGVAGGADSKGWILLQRVARQRGVDLSGARVQYAAPPLLSQALKRGQLDAIVTYWHFAARLRGAGEMRSAIRLSELLGELSLRRDLPVLGYVFDESWVADRPELLQRFALALTEAKQELATELAYWSPLRLLMRDPDDNTFRELRTGFVDGIPPFLDDDRIADLQRLLTLVGTDRHRLIDAGLFYRAEP